MTRFVFSTLIFAFLFGCPTIQTVVLNIDGIELAEGSLKGQSFDLIVYGQGFGVDQVSYDIAKQTGVAEKPAYQFRIVDAAGSILALAEGNQIKIVSTNRMEVNFILATGLSDGTYDLELALTGPNAPLLDTLRNGIRVGEPIDMPADAGLTADTGPADSGQAAPDSGAMAPADTGVSPRDAGEESVLGPWQGNYRYRREVKLTNPTMDTAPGGLTIRVTIPHGNHIQAGQAQLPAENEPVSDLALYWNSQEIPYQWEDQNIAYERDTLALNTLTMIAKLPETDPIPAGPLNQAVLVLYFNDPSATPRRTDDVFDFVERFSAPLSGWETSDWGLACSDRRGQTRFNSYCVEDRAIMDYAPDLASPNTTLSSAPSNPLVTYELSFWLAGRMGGANDLLLFYYSRDNTDDLQRISYIPRANFTENPPDQPLPPSMASGWKLPSASSQTWTRTVAHFVPGLNNPSLHFRFLSPDGVLSTTTQVAVDDIQVRTRLNPDFEITLGPVESKQ